MLTIRIAGEERKCSDLNDIDESWINQRINRRRADGQLICVEVSLDTSAANLVLTTPACSLRFGGGRQANPCEREIFGLWDKHHLNTSDFTGGDVVAFLKQLRRLALVRN